MSLLGTMVPVQICIMIGLSNCLRTYPLATAVSLVKGFALPFFCLKMRMRYHLVTANRSMSIES